MDQGLLHLVFENNRQNLIITKERRCLNKRRRNISQFSPKKKTETVLPSSPPVVIVVGYCRCATTRRLQASSGWLGPSGR